MMITTWPTILALWFRVINFYSHTFFNERRIDIFSSKKWKDNVKVKRDLDTKRKDEILGSVDEKISVMIISLVVLFSLYKKSKIAVLLSGFVNRLIFENSIFIFQKHLFIRYKNKDQCFVDFHVT